MRHYRRAPAFLNALAISTVLVVSPPLLPVYEGGEFAGVAVVR